jgi:hypothetical protein
MLRLERQAWTLSAFRSLYKRYTEPSVSNILFQPPEMMISGGLFTLVRGTLDRYLYCASVQGPLTP